MYSLRAALALALILSACGGDDDPIDPIEPIEYVDRIVLPATTESYTLSFGAVIEGAAMGWTEARGLVGAVSIDGGTGTVEIDGQVHRVALDQIHPWPAHRMTLYQGLVTLPDRLYLMWFYCADDRLFTVYTEGTDGTPLTYQAATGTCAEAPPAPVTVDLPALDMPLPPLEGDFAIDGDDASVDGAAPGWVVAGGRQMAVYGFQRVDCADCGSPGWQELHGLFWDEPAQALHIGSLYLHPGGGVQLVTWWSRPAPGTILNQQLAARWRLVSQR